MLQIDVMRGLAIIAVVVTHSLTVDTLVGSWAVLHVWQAVPVFFVIMGMNSASAGWSRLPGRLRRLLVPFAFAWLASLAIGLWKGTVYTGWESLLLRLPFPGPGNYFTPVAIAFAIAAPVLVPAYRRWPAATVVACVAADLAFELAAARLALFASHPYVYSAMAPRYLAAFALGMWLADDRFEGAARRRSLLAFAASSLAYLVAANGFGVQAPFVTAWRTQNLLAVGYPVLLVATGLSWLPAAPGGRVARALAAVGRSSYGIFLAQMTWFMVVPQKRPVWLAASIVVSVCAGMLATRPDAGVRLAWKVVGGYRFGGTFPGREGGRDPGSGRDPHR